MGEEVLCEVIVHENDDGYFSSPEDEFFYFDEGEVESLVVSLGLEEPTDGGEDDFVVVLCGDIGDYTLVDGDVFALCCVSMGFGELNIYLRGEILYLAWDVFIFFIVDEHL